VVSGIDDVQPANKEPCKDQQHHPAKDQKPSPTLALNDVAKTRKKPCSDEAWNRPRSDGGVC
jgi:hypothetical protein